MSQNDEHFFEEAFPLGDGTADTGAVVYCPHCGEPNDIVLDPGSGTVQEYIEDCAVCCRPWSVRVRYAVNGAAEVWLTSADD